MIHHAHGDEGEGDDAQVWPPVCRECMFNLVDEPADATFDRWMHSLSHPETAAVPFHRRVESFY